MTSEESESLTPGDRVLVADEPATVVSLGGALTSSEGIIHFDVECVMGWGPDQGGKCWVPASEVERCDTSEGLARFAESVVERTVARMSNWLGDLGDDIGEPALKAAAASMCRGEWKL